MKAGQAANVLDEIAALLDTAGGKKGSSEITQLSKLLRENSEKALGDVVPAANADVAVGAYYQALSAAGNNRHLFDAVYQIVKNDKLIDASRMSDLAARYSGMPPVKGRPKALQIIRDKFETAVQRERKLREIDRLNQD